MANVINSQFKWTHRSRPVVVEVSQLVGQPLHVLRLQTRGVLGKVEESLTFGCGTLDKAIILWEKDLSHKGAFSSIDKRFHVEKKNLF